MTEKKKAEKMRENKMGSRGHGGRVFEAARLLGTDYRELLDFSANLNPFGCPERVKQAMEESLSQVLVYPDPSSLSLRMAIAGREQVDASWVCAGAGAADIIFRICYGLRPARGLVCSPSFLEYERALLAAGAQVMRLRTEECEEQGQYRLEDPVSPDGGKLDPAALLQAGDVVFLCNPNNPTGLFVDADWGLSFLNRCKDRGIHVVMDECFLDFTGQERDRSWKCYLEQYPNLMILKSFTKMFAIPGIRLGYVLCADERRMQKVLQAGQAWGLNCVAERAGIAAAEETRWAEETAKKIRPLRESLQTGLEALGFSVKPGQANFLLLHAPGQRNLCEQLLQRRILLRSCANYDGLGEEDYRTAVRTEPENARLLQALKEITERRGK